MSAGQTAIRNRARALAADRHGRGQGQVADRGRHERARQEGAGKRRRPGEQGALEEGREDQLAARRAALAGHDDGAPPLPGGQQDDQAQGGHRDRTRPDDGHGQDRLRRNPPRLVLLEQTEQPGLQVHPVGIGAVDGRHADREEALRATHGREQRSTCVERMRAGST